MHVLHRYVGLTAALFAILLSVTGVLLNHTEELKLQQHSISSPWLLALYGINTPEIITAYELEENNWVVEYGESMYLHNKPIKCTPSLLGAIATPEILLISNPEQLCLFSLEGELIDNLSVPQNNKIKRMGLTDQSEEASIIIDTERGLYSLNKDFTDFVPYPQNLTIAINWKTPSSSPSSLATSLSKAHRGDGLPWERVILDLHSGRIFGIAGVLFMDFIAILIIFLSMTGVMMWSKRRPSKRKSRQC